MALAMVPTLWVCSFLLATTSGVYGLGVNWGTQMAQNLHPSVVVQMLKDNKINKVKLFDSDHWTVKFFAGTGIEVMPGIPNNQLHRFSDDYDNAKDWVKENITKHLYEGGVDIKYVAVGNEPFLTSYNGSYLKVLFPAMQNIQKALNEAGVGDKIKASSPQNADVYGSGSQGPSAGDFRSDIRDLMKQIVSWLNSNGSPFIVNIYPFLSLYESANFPIEFAFFDGGAKPVQDNNVQYTNMLDANLDTLYYALKKNGASRMKVMIGEIGWPTDGNINANIKYAKRFYNGLLRKLASDKGTPTHPGYIETYLFSLTDENMKSIAPGNFERHWGIFRYDGQPKFPIDFSGQGQEKMPVGAKNIVYQAKQWCVYNTDIKNYSAAAPEIEYACTIADCSSLYYGSTCNNLDVIGNYSYAFNIYYQMQNQDVEACRFNGFAKIVHQNASRGECLFPIAIESGGDRPATVAGLSFLAGLLSFLALSLV